jgi:hypothetical protein
MSLPSARAQKRVRSEESDDVPVPSIPIPTVAKGPPASLIEQELVATLTDKLVSLFKKELGFDGSDTEIAEIKIAVAKKSEDDLYNGDDFCDDFYVKAGKVKNRAGLLKTQAERARKVHPKLEVAFRACVAKPLVTPQQIERIASLSLTRCQSV